MLLTGMAFLSGIITVLSPCILPLLPIILAGAWGTDRLRPLGIIAGFISTFSLITLTISVLVERTGLSPDHLRSGAVMLLIILGLFIIIPRLQLAFEHAVSSLIPKNVGRTKGKGFWGGFLIGTGLGLVWSPCVGPIMASVITLAASNNLSGQAVGITFAYATGTALPMLAIMLGGRKLLVRFPFIMSNTSRMQKAFGVVLVITGLVMAIGIDRKIQAWVLQTFPSYERTLTSIEHHDAVINVVERSLQKN